MRVARLWGGLLVCVACARQESSPAPGDAAPARAPAAQPSAPRDEQGHTRAERQRYRNQLELARLEQEHGPLPRHAMTEQEPRCVVACARGSGVRGVLLVATDEDVPTGCLPPKLRGDAGADTLSAWCNQYLPACEGRCRVAAAPAATTPSSAPPRRCTCPPADPLCSCL